MTRGPYNTPLRTAIMEYLRTCASARMTDIAEAMRQPRVGDCLNDLVAQGSLIRVRRGHYAIHPRLRKEAV